MKILGITGRSGSGKGYVCALFAKHAIPTVDTDAIVHALYRENDACIVELEHAFGALRSEDGSIDRKKLAQIVFSDRSKLAQLNAIVHRYVTEEVKRLCACYEQEGVAAVLVDAPQLYEAHLETVCDHVIAVVAPEPLRVERIRKRDGLTEEGAQARLTSQLDDAYFRSHADTVIVNDGDSDVEGQVAALLSRILS